MSFHLEGRFFPLPMKTCSPVINTLFCLMIKVSVYAPAIRWRVLCDSDFVCLSLRLSIGLFFVDTHVHTKIDYPSFYGNWITISARIV